MLQCRYGDLPWSRQQKVAIIYNANILPDIFQVGALLSFLNGQNFPKIYIKHKVSEMSIPSENGKPSVRIP